jgi:hypothetical protein
MHTRLHRARAIPLAIAIGAAVCTPSVCTTDARSDDKESCITAHENSQVLRRDGKLRAARDQMILCSRDSCPTVLRKDCSQWLGEVDESIPSIVVEGKGPDGQDATEMKVYMDGQLLIDKLDGRAIQVDPGPHTFKYEVKGAKAREEKVLIREGQKNRKITVDFSPPRPANTAASASTGLTANAPPERLPRPVPVLVYVLGGVGMVALGGSAFMYARGLGQRSDLDAKGCKPACAQDDVDAAKQSLLIGDIAMGVGVASLGVATVLYFTRPAKKPSKEAAWTFDLQQTPGGALAGFRGAF